ncbi:unnamed protein product [Mytilus coruscus]|uniref:Uncharacterized protein n=1 Tax=Mytilus coruscus TaxID=42192 RepID=A0A6J8DSD2_MYTCO|nr:unnamed protein product [Mytilus coruscus]
MSLYINYLIVIWITCKASFKDKPCYSEAGIGCTVYYSSKQDCASLSANFPELYQREDGLYPDKPSLFDLIPIEEKWTDKSTGKHYMYPGVNVTFKVPPNASFKSVKGFELIGRSTNPDDTRCFVFSFNGSQLNANTKDGEIQFRIWAIVVQIETFFDFEVFSLPKPPENELDGMSIIKTVTMNMRYDLSKPSANWITTISFYPSSVDKLIYIRFVEPPEQYNFTQFVVNLWELDQHNNDVKVVKSVTISQYEHYFHDVPPGQYKVKVEPKSSYASGQCFCFNNNGVCVSCARTTTRPIIIENLSTSGTTTTSTTTTTSATTTTTNTVTGPDTSFTTNTYTPSPVDVGPDSPNAEKVVAVVFGIILGLLLVGILAFIAYSNRRKKHDSENIETDPFEDHAPTTSYKPTDTTSYPTTESAYHINTGELVKIPTVFIVCAEDHQYHVNAVEAFARFLDSHCQCNVVYAPWCLHEYLDGKFRWVINTIEKADFVIIVNSELSYHQFKSWKNKEDKFWKSPDASQTFDLYMSSVSQITKRIINVNNHFKCIIVHFNYTANKFSLDELCIGAEYQIPKHIHELMCQIHQMDNRRAGYDNIGYFADLIGSTSDGQHLSTCITLAANFEKQNPNWFNEYFENAEQFDSGISSPSTSLGGETGNKRSSNVSSDGYVKDSHQTSPPKYNIRGYNSRQNSFDDNNIVDNFSRQALRTSDPSSDDFTFKAPSDIEDEDILSQQLRQEIYDLNRRALESQYQNEIAPPYHPSIVFRGMSQEEEIQSLGGQSV